jgi:hypothetical protein
MMLAADSAHFEKTVNTTPNPRIILNNTTGQIVIRGWSRAQVHALYATSSPQVEVDTSVLPTGARAEKIHFDTHVLDPLGPGKDQGADYAIDVPVGANLEINSRQGGVVIQNLQGEASVDSVGGMISVRDVGGHLSVRSVGGDIEVVRPSGRVEASSITGNLRFISGVGSQLRGVTTSGRISYEGDFASGGNYELSSYNGDIDILCPSSASFEVNAKTVRGKVDNALAIIPNRRPSRPAASGLFGTRNTGEATVELKSFSGTIRIRPQP